MRINGARKNIQRGNPRDTTLNSLLEEEKEIK